MTYTCIQYSYAANGILLSLDSILPRFYFPLYGISDTIFTKGFKYGGIIYSTAF